MKSISIRKHIIPLWLVSVILVSVIGAGAVGYYVWKTVTIPFEVKEPIEVLGYPSEISLYPGESRFFVINLINHGSVDYSIILDFHLSNATYQDNYVTFSNETYEIIPGEQNISAEIDVESYAPLANETLTVDFQRVQSLSFADGFDSPHLRNEWHFVDISGNSSVALTGDYMLRMTTVSPPWRDLEGNYENAPHMVLHQIRGNFSLETSVFATTNESEESAGILVWKDPHHHLRFEQICKIVNDQLEQQIILVVEGGESVTMSLSTPPIPIFLRLVRSGQTFSGYYSTVGMLRGWYHVGDATFQASDPVDVGLDITNSFRNGVFSADFDYFVMTIQK